MKPNDHEINAEKSPTSALVGVPGTPQVASRAVICGDFRTIFSRLATQTRCFYRRDINGDEFLGLGVSSAQDGLDLGDAQTTLAARFNRLRELIAPASDTHPNQTPDAYKMLRLLGWSAFDPDYAAKDDSNWAGFSRKELYIPEALLHRHGDEVTATVVAPAREHELIWRRLESRIEPPEPASGSPIPAAKRANSRWLDRVTFCQGVQQVIENRAALKVVLARRAALTMSDENDVHSALVSLVETYPTCTHFAISAPENTEYPIFFGATPERLAKVDQGRVETMALAGTANRADDAHLLASPKIKDEHRFVVDMIVDALRGLCADFRTDATPQIKPLSNISHLLTEIQGTLAEGIGLAEVVDALHPTPAVCGTPRELARTLIAQLEGFDRGLYAGTLGWMDLDGNGEFDVALRCGLLSDEKALLFAGAGITSDSDIDEEWAETRAKFEPMLNALGARVQS